MGKYSYNKVMELHQEALNERADWEAEYRQISQFLLPGRGIYNTYSKPRKRKLTTGNVINTVAEDALYVLTSGMHGGLTSPSRPWFDLAWADQKVAKVEPLKAWMQDNTKKLHAGLQASNFYSIINSFYIELVGFGTACTYVGEDSEEAPFRFEILTAGEYSFTAGANGRPDMLFRTLFMSPRQIVNRFGNKAPANMRRDVKDNKAGTLVVDRTILEVIYKEQYQDKPFTREYYSVTSPGQGVSDGGAEKPLERAGFYEFPYPVARWNTTGSDVYGIGPGSRALPDIRRLQEMEKAFLMATHKSINPPLNAPARMKGKLNTLPGGYNYYSNPSETVNEIYQIRFDYQGVGAAIERVEQRIQKNFFNDIFLTAARDPNASPLRTGQVQVQEQEKMLRLGPVIERLQHEFLLPLIERCFNIMLRKEMFDELSPELAMMAGDYKITLTSPMATAQRAVALQGINAFMGFIGQAAQFDQTILDNIDVDKAAREMADISGVDIGILRPADEVAQIRQAKAQAMQAEKQKQEQAQEAQMASSISAEQAGAQKVQSEAGLNMLEGQQIQDELGLV